MRSSSLFSPMAAVRRPSPHRSLAAVLLSLRALTGKPGSSGREEGCREGERRKAMGGSTVAARRDMRRKKDDIMVATVWKPTKTKARASSSLNDYNECKKERGS
uniref:Uncharacterized protein n=1 Tax=Oryza nivara TaxID=4536 RepID=A0A0E0GRM5_ORYNI